MVDCKSVGRGHTAIIYLGRVHPQRLAVVYPGRLSMGVTPRNLLHASRRRNEGLGRVFHDLGQMERRQRF